MIHLVIGASGFIGNSLYSLLKKNRKEVIGTYFSYEKPNLFFSDMTKKSDLEILFNKHTPNITYMPAFIPGVDNCEKSEETNVVNKNGIRNVVDICKEYNSKLIFYSSDYIFNGISGPYLETEKYNPINRYGSTKVICEKYVKELPDFLIIRTTIVYGYDINSKNFLMTLVSDLKNNKKRRVPIDQIGSPTYVKDLVNISLELVNKSKKGIYNVAGPDLCTRYEFALKIARIFELNENLIIPVSTSELKQKAKRPLKAGLLIDKIRTEIDAKPLGIDQALNLLKKYFI